MDLPIELVRLIYEKTDLNALAMLSLVSTLHQSNIEDWITTNPYAVIATLDTRIVQTGVAPDPNYTDYAYVVTESMDTVVFRQFTYPFLKTRPVDGFLFDLVSVIDTINALRIYAKFVPTNRGYIVYAHRLSIRTNVSDLVKNIAQELVVNNVVNTIVATQLQTRSLTKIVYHDPLDKSMVNWNQYEDMLVKIGRTLRAIATYDNACITLDETGTIMVGLSDPAWY
jgi:hypothetical protein